MPGPYLPARAGPWAGWYSRATGQPARGSPTCRLALLEDMPFHSTAIAGEVKRGVPRLDRTTPSCGLADL